MHSVFTDMDGHGCHDSMKPQVVLHYLPEGFKHTEDDPTSGHTPIRQDDMILRRKRLYIHLVQHTGPTFLLR